MSEENVAVVRGMSDAFRNQDWAAAFEPVHPEIVMDATRVPIEGLARVYEGAEEVAGFWREWLEAWGGQSWADEEFIDAGDRVVFWVPEHHLQGRGSGIEVDIPPYAWVMTLRDGKIIQAALYLEKSEALEAAGLSERAAE